MATATKKLSKVKAIKEFIREQGEVSRKEIIRFLMVNLRGVDGDYFDNNYNDYKGQSATNFTQWLRNGHVTSTNGIYSLTPEGAESKLGMYYTLPHVLEQRENKRRERVNVLTITDWQSRALRAEAELKNIKLKLFQLI